VDFQQLLNRVISDIRFYFYIFPNVLGGLPVISFEKSQIRLIIQCFPCIPKKLLKIIKNDQFFLIPVLNSSLICYCQYHDIHQIIIQIFDDLLVFPRLTMYFKVIGMSSYFICTMKLAPNSNIFYMHSQNVLVNFQ